MHLPGPNHQQLPISLTPPPLLSFEDRQSLYDTKHPSSPHSGRFASLQSRSVWNAPASDYALALPSNQHQPHSPHFNVQTPSGSSSNPFADFSSPQDQTSHPTSRRNSSSSSISRSPSPPTPVLLDNGSQLLAMNPQPVPQQEYQQPSMPQPQPPQPLFAQHSGQASSFATAGSSRPSSSMHSAPMNPSLLHQSGPGSTTPTRVINQGVANMNVNQQPQPTSTTAGMKSSSSSMTSGPAVSVNARSPFSTAISSPPRSRASQILLINPTSSLALTSTLLTNLRPILPPQLEVVAYTAPYPAPLASESTVDACLASEVILRDLAKYATNNGETVQNFDALLVASYGKHPLIDALREYYDVPVIGIMEGSLYVSRMLGTRFGILVATTRSKTVTDDAVRAYGLDPFYVGAEAVHLSQLELLPLSSDNGTAFGGRPIEEVTKRIAHAARSLVARGADTLILGCEGMSSVEVTRMAKDAVREDDGRRVVNVVDAVEAGVMCLNALVGMGVPTSKKGAYRSERDSRRARGQNWL